MSDYAVDNRPLAEKMRPDDLSGFFGQAELVGADSFLRKAIEADNVPSMILWGPPGTGKTTLANIIAQKTNSDFVRLSAVSSGKKDLLLTVERAEGNKRLARKTILFVDEIHRWNKAQQDALLPHVERGTIILIGATTENPSFEINSALLSRTRVFVLQKLEQEDLLKILQRALKIVEPIHELVLSEGILELITSLANGDARTSLNILEICLQQVKDPQKITPELVKQVVQKSNLFYDKNGEEHYNIISALHKSLRGGDAHAGLYWLARMLEAGEDPLYVARRLLRFAAEDVGTADSFALVLANSVFESCRKLGMPECNVHLSQLVIYLASTKKSILAYDAYGKAKQDVLTHGNLGVPLHIRNAPTKLMKDLDYGKGYKYSPKEDSAEQTYFPDELKGRKYW